MIRKKKVSFIWFTQRFRELIKIRPTLVTTVATPMCFLYLMLSIPSKPGFSSWVSVTCYPAFTPSPIIDVCNTIWLMFQVICKNKRKQKYLVSGHDEISKFSQHTKEFTIQTHSKKKTKIHSSHFITYNMHIKIHRRFFTNEISDSAVTRHLSTLGKMS
jgi:hypothetical protein